MSQSINLPQHIAIIMDGNGRWATKHNKHRKEGHKEGAKIVRDVTQWCAKKGIAYLTLYAFSTENWNRPKMEVEFLMNLLQSYLQKEQPLYIKHNIKFRAIGDISAFSKKLQNAILALENITQNHTKLTQILALNYGARDEIARSVLKLSSTLKDNSHLDSKAMIDLISANLDTATLPDVDMLIRTGGEKRISNFLLWQTYYAELFFTNTLWPDFKTTELESMLKDYALRQRRFGGL